ncbi:MAG: OmpA family protein [Burkholderiales bacterium]
MNATLTRLTVAAAVLMWIAAPARAEELRHTVTLNDPNPSNEAIESALFPEEIQKQKQECAELVKAGYKCQSVIPKASLETNIVTFVRGSANLTDTSRQFLRRVGEVLKKRQDGLQGLVIEGHTDATGGDSLNRKLSQARAESVRKFLASEYGIARIETRGRGSAQLKDKSDPGNEINRRIEFVTQ